MNDRAIQPSISPLESCQMGSKRPLEMNAMEVGTGGWDVSHSEGFWLKDLLTPRFCIPREPPYFTGCHAIEE